MFIQKYSRYVLCLMAIVLAAGYFSLGEPLTAYAQGLISADAFDLDSFYLARNNRRLLGLMLLAVTAFGIFKGWRRGVVLGCFLLFLGFASVGLFIYGKLIATWLSAADSKFIPAAVFFLGGILYINLLHKIHKLMYAFLKKLLYKTE